MVTTFTDFALRLWSDRCDALHGKDEVEVKGKMQEKMVGKVRESYLNMDQVLDKFKYFLM